MANFITYENDLNRINLDARRSPENFVKKTEEAFNRNLRHVAREIAAYRKGCRLVILFGPSSSGKTTTSHLLHRAFHKIGIASSVLSLDDFYLCESRVPLLPNGRHDYESLQALDIPELRQCLKNLIEHQVCDMPVYDFETKRPSGRKRHVELGENGIAVVEGIHALNPLITNELPAEKIRTIYIGVEQGIQNGGKELFTPNDMRLVRRIVRDDLFRGADAEQTLSIWHAVLEGEKEFIRPFQDKADYFINSLHPYESCVLKERAAALLHGVPESSAQYDPARKMLGVLSQFESISSGLVPENSILREFMGKGR